MAAQPSAFELTTDRLGPLPVVNHFLDRLGLDRLLDQLVPTTDPRCPLRYGKARGVLLRSVLVEREPIYRHYDTVNTVSTFAATAFSLEHDELHNDSTTVRFAGQYRRATGRSLRGRRAPWITYGYSKDHRPDLKQLLLVLTTTHDGAVPVATRAADGNTNDITTHLQTWRDLCQATGRRDFLYVADSKLCATEVMETIDREGGRFITVLPRSRSEDEQFRRWIQTHDPDWELIVDRPNPRRKQAPRDRWWATRAPLPSMEGYSIVRVKSSLLALKQHKSRHERIATATEELEELDRILMEGRGRKPKTPDAIRERIDAITGRLQVGDYLDTEIRAEADHRFRQTRRGRPGANTSYRRETRYRFRINWKTNEEKLVHEQASDGMYPLITNDRSLSPRHVLETHKRQPSIEKRFGQLKNVHEIAPVLLKNEGRIEAFFFIYFLALLVAALIEREIRRAMKKADIQDLPLYPEQRSCPRPTYEQISRLFERAERHTLQRNGRFVEVFNSELSPLQRQVLRLLGVSTRAYSTPN